MVIRNLPAPNSNFIPNPNPHPNSDTVILIIGILQITEVSYLNSNPNTKRLKEARLACNALMERFSDQDLYHRFRFLGLPVGNKV